MNNNQPNPTTRKTRSSKRKLVIAVPKRLVKRVIEMNEYFLNVNTLFRHYLSRDS